MLAHVSNYIVAVIMWPKFGNSSISVREVIIPSILQGFDQKKQFFERCSWFKFNDLELAIRMALKFCTSVSKGVKLKVRKFWRLISMLVKVAGEKLVREGRGEGVAFRSPLPILNRFKSRLFRFVLVCYN